MKKEYLELLKDPRWQKKRLEIFALDHWQCRACFSKTGTLNVHHLFYISGNNPWEYENDALITLCERCHERAKGINWKQAFLDLNLPESELLELAMQLHFLKKKWTLLTADIQEKFKTRFMHLSMHYDHFESSDEVDDYFNNFRDALKGKYIDE